MKNLSVMFALLTMLAQPAFAKERFYLQFELFQGEQRINQGSMVISDESRTWSKGLERNYLVLNCDVDEKGGVQKNFSTFRQFAGLRITHQVIGSDLVLKISRTTEDRRIGEIHALRKDECKNLRPIITTTSQDYRIPADRVGSEPVNFGDGLRFQFTMTQLGGTR